MKTDFLYGTEIDYIGYLLLDLIPENELTVKAGKILCEQWTSGKQSIKQQ